MTKNQTQNSIIDQIVVRAHSLRPAARVEFLRKHSTAEIIAIHTRIVGKPKPKTPRPVMEKRILAALAEPTPATRRDEAPASERADVPESKPVDQSLDENPVAAANAASWDAALPEPGYVPPAGTGDEHAAHDDPHDAAPATEDAAATSTHDAASAPTTASGAIEAASATAPAGRAPRERDSRMPPIGTLVIKKDRRGNERSRCTIEAGGILYNGQLYKSLSAAALASARDLGLETKTMDGWAWWQLKARSTPAAAKKNPLEALERAFQKYRDRADAAVKSAKVDDRAKVQQALAGQAAALQRIAAPETPEAHA